MVKSEIKNMHSKRSIRNLNLSDFSYIKQIRLKETKLACMENWN